MGCLHDFAKGKSVKDEPVGHVTRDEQNPNRSQLDSIRTRSIRHWRVWLCTETHSKETIQEQLTGCGYYSEKRSAER